VVPLEKMVKKPKMAKLFFRPFSLNVCTTIKKDSQIYSLHALTYGLKFILEQKIDF
jgi:hypothetical protein